MVWLLKYQPSGPWQSFAKSCLSQAPDYLPSSILFPSGGLSSHSQPLLNGFTKFCPFLQVMTDWNTEGPRLWLTLLKLGCDLPLTRQSSSSFCFGTPGNSQDWSEMLQVELPGSQSQVSVTCKLDCRAVSLGKRGRSNGSRR